MNSLTFYRGNAFFADVKLDTGSTQQTEIMGTDQIQLKFQSTSYIDFRFGDYCTVFGTKYIIQNLPTVKKMASNYYEYGLTAKAEAMELEKAQFLFLGADNSLREPDFALMGSALDFLNLIVTNINRISSGWSVGTVLSTGEFKNLTFSKDNCLSALSSVAEAFGTEYWITGKTISLGKLENVRAISLSQGRGNGLYEITRLAKDDEPLITRLYVNGGEKNLPPSYRNYSKRLKMTAGAAFIENNTDKYGIVENTAVFEDVYPRRTGTVSAIDVDDEFAFTDSGIDFDVNAQLLAGLTAKVTFNTGQLAGITCEISNFNNSTKTFTINPNKDNTYVDLPNESIRIAVGDKYVITDIQMPDSYVTAAEAELVNKANEFLIKYSEPIVAYQVVFDQKYYKENSLNVAIGDLLTINDADLNVSRQIRVINVTRDIVNENDLKIELADKVTYGTINRLQITQDATVRQVANINTQVQTAIGSNIFKGNFRIIGGQLLIPDMLTVDSTLAMYPVYWNEAKGFLKAYKP
jgi:hypothetical protein